MADLSTLWPQVQEIVAHLFNMRQLLETLARPEFTVAAFVVLSAVVFTETGLLVGFFLPGDSLLVTAGVVCAASDWNLPLLLAILSLAAIAGDTVGYAIGYRSGPKIFNRERSLLFKKAHLLKAQEFYVKHGGKTIIIARFMPIIRTFAPVVAGVGRMNYGRFVLFNVCGGIGWVFSMVLTGYYLVNLVNPPMRSLLQDPAFDVKDHIEKVIILVVVLSILPAFLGWARSKLRRAPVLAEASRAA